MNPLPINDVTESGIINPVGNHMIKMDLTDDTNQNSAFVTYYQINKVYWNDDRKKLAFGLVINYL